MNKKLNAAAISYSALCLVIICLVTTLAVAGTRYAFKDKIAQQEWLEKQAVMKQLIAADSYQEIPLPDDRQGYQALAKDGTVKGWLFVTASYGYGSEISVMTGISDGQIAAIAILDCSNETPGLGQNVAKETFTQQFATLTAAPTVTKSETTASDQIQAVTGATKSSNAVAHAVSEALALAATLDQ